MNKNQRKLANFFPMGNKFGAIRTRCMTGHSHPSKGEAKHCDELHMVLRSGKYAWKQIEYEKKYNLVVNGVLVGTHRPDWTITHCEDSVSIVEFKGAETRDWLLRKKLFMAIYPDIPYTVVKAGG
jgi:hypothetical protein